MSAGGEFASLIPHAGTMCLLERLVSWSERGAAIATRSHLATNNPLKRAGRLHAINLCEYGAQAMAIHGALMARSEGGSLAPGLLVSLRDVELAATHVESLPGELLVEVERLAAGAAGLQYAFRVSHAGAPLASGRAAIIESRASAQARDR